MNEQKPHLISSEKTPVDADPSGTVDLKTDSGRSPKGKIIGNYQLILQLGRGGMGTVFLARHNIWRDKRFAIKLVRPGVADDSTFARFLKEIKAMGEVAHPNLINATDAGIHDDQLYLVMEYVAGADLGKIIKEHGPLPIADACEAIRQASRGIQHAHDRGIIHRDIKPSNILLGKDGTAKVLDLGLASMRDASVSKQLTAEGNILGTPDYIPPEQWQNTRNVDALADVYSLGCTLFCLLTGKPPFAWASEETSVFQKMNAHLKVVPSAASVFRDGISKDLDKLVLESLAKDPAQRIATADQFAEMLVPFCGNSKLSQHSAFISTEIEKDFETITQKLEQESTKKSVHEGETTRHQKKGFDFGLQVRKRGCAISVSIGLVLMFALFAASPIWLEFQRKANITLSTEGLNADQHPDSQTASVKGFRKPDSKQILGKQPDDLNANLLMSFEAVDQFLVAASSNRKLDPSERLDMLNSALPMLEEIIQRKELDDTKILFVQAKAHRHLAKVYQQLGQDEKSTQALNQYVSISKQIFVAENNNVEFKENLVAAYIQLANQQARFNRLAKAEENFLRALVLCNELHDAEASNPKRKMMLAAVQSNLGTLNASKKSDFPEANKYFEEALKLHTEIEKSHPDNIDNLLSLVRLYTNHGNSLVAQQKTSKAEVAFKAGLKIASAGNLILESNPDFLSVDANLNFSYSLLLQAIQKNTEAEQCLSRAIDHYKKLAVLYPRVPGHRFQLAEMKQAFGFVLMRNQKDQVAIKEIDEALAILQKLTNDYPTNEDFQKMLSSTLDLKATIKTRKDKVKKKDFDEAVKLYQQALNLRLKLAEDSPSVLEYHQLVAASFFNLGLVFENNQQPVKAENNYLTSLKHYRDLVNRAPKSPVFALGFTDCLNNLANLYIGQKRPDDAKTIYREMIPVLNELPVSSHAVLFKLARIQSNLGEQFNDAKNQKVAVEYLTEAINTFEKAHILLPKHFDTRVLLASTLIERAEIFGGQGGIEEGRKDWERAIAVAPAEVKIELQIQKFSWDMKYSKSKKNND